MDLISIILFILTFVLIISIIFFDLSKYKYHYFTAIIILGVGLYTYGLIYEDPNPNYLDVVLKAFGNTSQILRGIFRTSEIMPRINNDILFLISAYAIHVLGFGYTYVLVFAIFFKNLNLRMRFHLQKHRAHTLVLADDDRVRYMLESFQLDAKHKKPWVNLALSKTLLSKRDIKTNYAYKPGVTSFDVHHQNITHLLGKTKGSNLISLISQESDVLALIEQLNTYFSAHPTSELSVHILYEREDRLPVYESFSQHRHRLNFFSYAQLVARSFIFDYPLTRLLPQRLIQTEKATLKKATIHYHLVGMKTTNQALYQHLFVTNQFPQANTSLMPKDWFGKEPLQYHLYDDTVIPSSLLHDLTTYKNVKNYLPLPQLSSSTTPHLVDDYVQSIKERLLNSVDFQIVVIALESDIENLRVLQGVRDLVLKFRLHASVRIYVQLLHHGYAQHSELLKESFVQPLGQGHDVYRLQTITTPNFLLMAENIHTLLHPQTPFKQLSFQVRKAYTYEAISIRFRLNLMGYDLVQQDKGLSEKRFLEAYDPYQYRVENLEHLRARNDADIQKYYPKKLSIRSYLAKQEHQRRVAFQLVNGWAPMPIDDVMKQPRLQEESRSEDACITTFDGLLTIQKIRREKQGLSFGESDVIYPYFVTFDHLYHVLKGTPFKIIDKIDPQANQTFEISRDEVTDIQSSIKN